LSRTRVYITPFDESGNYATEIEVTKYVEGLGAITVDTDSSEYQIGVFRNSSVKLDLNNRDGLFSDIGIYQSIFRYARADAKVRITFLEADDLPYCGSAICGEAILCEETDVFWGLLSDESLTEEAGREVVSFIALGYEALFSRVVVPFSSVANGDLVSEVLFTCLNQTEITSLLTVDVLNIDPSLDTALDAVADLENMTVKKAVDELLLISNSVLKIVSGVVYVTPRTATASVIGTFYGQASTAGAENIVNVKNITNGKNRIFNYITWSQASAVYQNSTSVRLHGVRKKELSSSLVTDNTKQLAIQAELVSEFGFPKQEMELQTPINDTVVALNLLDRILVDYPTVYVPTEFPLPICGLAICGDRETATLPRGLWSLQIPSSRRYKIVKKNFDFKSMIATFKLREI